MKINNSEELKSMVLSKENIENLLCLVQSAQCSEIIILTITDQKIRINDTEHNALSTLHYAQCTINHQY